MPQINNTSNALYQPRYVQKQPSEAALQQYRQVQNAQADERARENQRPDDPDKRAEEARRKEEQNRTMRVGANLDVIA